MSEQEPETTNEPQADEATPEGAAVTDDDASGTEDVGTEDSDALGDAANEQHVSSATDLPEGAEVDPLTDAAPQQVVEDAEHDG